MEEGKGGGWLRRQAEATSGTGHKVQGGGGGWWATKIFSFKYCVQWPTPELFDKIGVAHPWSGTEKTSDPHPNQNQKR